MRSSLRLVAPIALLLAASPAFAATTSTNTTTHTIAQPITPVLIGLCQPAAGGGTVVAIPGLPNFQADSIESTNMTAIVQQSQEAKVIQHPHGTITIVRKPDSTSPKLFQMLSNNTLISSMSITMHKTSDSYIVLTLHQTAVKSIRQITNNAGASHQESVTFS